jgi:hypothetical protein
LFQGFDYPPLVDDSGRVGVSELEPPGATPFLDHVFHVICDGDAAKYNYFMKAVASMYRKPHAKLEVAFMLCGDQGCGKGYHFHDTTIIILITR